MYLIEIERCWKGKQKQTVVRLFDTNNSQILAETVYIGDPPGLCLLEGQDFTALRLPPVEA